MMKFCTRCGSPLNERIHCSKCGARAYNASHQRFHPEFLPAGDLPPFLFRYSEPVFLTLAERERQMNVAFSYVTGTLVGLRAFNDPTQTVHMRLWSQQDDPRVGPRGPIVGHEKQPSIRNIVHLRLASGEVRSFVLTQVRFRANAGDRITLIFPVSIERASNSVYDYAAIAAVDYTTHDLTWSTTHPQIYAIRSRLPEEQAERFADSLASYLDGLCRRCLRLFGKQIRDSRRERVHPEHRELTQ
jgi:hypothetical protein